MEKFIGDIRETNAGGLVLIVYHQDSMNPLAAVIGEWERDEDGGSKRLAEDMSGLFMRNADTSEYVRLLNGICEVCSPENYDRDTVLAQLTVEGYHWFCSFNARKSWGISAIRCFEGDFYTYLSGHCIEARGYDSLNVGTGNCAPRDKSVAVGDGNISDGTMSVTVGRGNVTATSSGTVAVGSCNKSDRAENSVLLGRNNKVKGSDALTVGISNTASKGWSAAMGFCCNAEGCDSMAIGIGAATEVNGEMVLGGRDISTINLQVGSRPKVDLLEKLGELEMRIAKLEK